MDYTKVITKGCCGKTGLAYRLEHPFAITTNFTPFVINARYLKSGIFYFEDSKIIGIVPFGSNYLQIKPKTHNIDPSINILESFLKNI